MHPDGTSEALAYTPPQDEENSQEIRASLTILEAVWKQSLNTRRGYLIYRARLRTDLLDNRSLDMLLEISKGLIY